MLIVGLGNPGKKYEKTRHNVGFMTIDEIAANFQFYNAKISKGKIIDKEIVLVKPQVFMNNSGKVVKKIIENCKFSLRECRRKIENLIVIHDDVDLPLGTVRVSKNSSSGGHKGVQSIIDELKTKNFTRIRIGIRPKFKIINTEKYVLQKFSKDEEKIIKKVIRMVVELIKKGLKKGIEKTTIVIPNNSSNKLST